MPPTLHPDHECNHSTNEAQFKIAFYRTPVCMMILSPEGIIERANEACVRLFETGVSRLCLVPLKDLISHGLLPKELTELCHGKAKHSIKTIEFKNRLGVKLWLQLQCISPRHLAADASKIIMIQNCTDNVKANILASELSSRIIQAQEEEKQLLSQEIHDTFSQSLAALKIAIQANTSVDEILHQVDQLIDQSRNIAHSLRPEIIGEQGLIPALTRLVIELKRRFNKRIFLKTNTNNINLPPNISLQLYRIAQESMINAGKHASASKIMIMIHKRGEYLTMQITDNGKGFDAKEIIGSAQKSSLGLKIMRERTKRIGAQYLIHSDIGKGTQIKVSYRLPKIKQKLKKTMV